MSTTSHSAPNTISSGLAGDGGLVLLPLDQVRPSDFNPRTDFDEAALQELAESLRRHGLLQPITVRRDLDRGGYEIIAGERRYRAALIAGWVQIPAIVRVCTDPEALELALIENLARRDINPMEEARGYLTLAGMGLTQAEIASRVNRQQPTISNRMRLLKLPESVQELINSGQLSASHGIALLQHYDGFPMIAGDVARWAAENSIPVATIEKGLGSVDYTVTDAMLKVGLVREIDYRCKFDTGVCRSCPHGAYRSGSYRSYCLMPGHAAELEAAAAEEMERKVAAAKEQLREAAQQNVKPGEAPAEAPDLPKLTDLHYSAYERISSRDDVPGCDENCRCRSLAIDHNGEIVHISTDPKHRASLRAQATKDERKGLRDTFGASMAQLVELQRHPDLDATSRALAVIARRCLSMAKVEDLRAVAKTLPEGTLRTQLEKPPFTHNEAESWAVYVDHPMEQIIHACVQVLARAEVREAVEYKHQRAPLLDWLLGREAKAEAPRPTAAQREPAEEPEETEAGVEPEFQEHCAQCGDSLPADVFDAEGTRDTTPDGVDYYLLTDPRGHVMMDDVAYCAECWPDVVHCRICGCTDECGCAEGCEWVEPDLCSACVDAAKAQALEIVDTAVAKASVFSDPEVRAPSFTPHKGMRLRSVVLPQRTYQLLQDGRGEWYLRCEQDQDEYSCRIEHLMGRFVPIAAEEAVTA